MQTRFAGSDTTLRNWKPSEYLSHVERRANCIRKLLAEVRYQDGCTSPASKDDAERLCKLVEELARRGRNQSAQAAAATADRVELLFRLLSARIDELLSPGR